MIWQFKAPNITPSTITSEPKSNKPSEPLTTEFSPSLLSPRAERIARSLQRQYNRAQAQAAAEQDQEFTYRPAPLGAFPSPFVDRTLQHLHEESASQRIGGYSSGFCHFIGRRNVMEDKHLSDTFNFPIQDTLHTAVIFGVFDGHGGNQAAEFVEKNLTAILQSTLAEHCKEGLTQERIRDALKETFRSLNKLFLPAQSGTTAALAMILGNRLWTANVGDSRIILDNGIQLTEDAKPTDPRYVKKITKLNGFVTNGRVNGTLAVARAIGDHHVRGMCAEATIIDHPISEIPENSHLILVCDGISDVASTRQMAQVVRNNNQLSAEVLARNLVFSAHSSFSGDNLSALVVKIKPTN
jgi:protein phosphatase 2C family protein 2/3